MYFGGRHLMKSNNTKLIVRLLVFVFVLLFVLAGTGVWWQNATSPYDAKDETSVIFTIARGEAAKDIANNLAQEKLIRSPLGFYLFVKVSGLGQQMQAGDFRLSRSMNAETIARTLTHGMMDVWVTTLEGWRIEEIATKMAQDLAIPEKEFLRVAEEGYMFPDTYRVSQDASAAAIATMFKENLMTKLTPQMIADAQKKGMDLKKVLILASIVEREGHTNEDRPVIAGILLNRLEKDWPLQADATLQYALGYQTKEKTWWKKELTNADKEVDSPYNTYKYPGLPPGPIANPGIAAINAVIYPKKSDYMFYIHDPKGGVHYAKTVEEHNANVSKYLQ